LEPAELAAVAAWPDPAAVAGRSALSSACRTARLKHAASKLFTPSAAYDKRFEMLFFSRLLLCLSAPLLLSSCQLINAALRLAPLAMFLVDDGGKGAAAAEQRGREVQARGPHGIMPAETSSRSAVAMRR
jgi:hypothetical protein